MADLAKAALPVREGGAEKKGPPPPPELPEDIIRRNEIFAELKKKHDEEALKKEHIELKIVLDLGVDAEGKPRGEQPATARAFETKPSTYLRDLPKEVTADVVVCRVNGELWDLDRPLETDCTVSYVPFSSKDGRFVFWHSAAHVLGEAAECQYGCKLSHGPPVEQGFFYDMKLENDETVKESDWKPLETHANRIFKEKQPFERLHCSLEDLERMFHYSKYKMHYIKNLLPKEGASVYRCGTLVDLCTGPHIQNTNKIKAFQIMKNSSCYFLGDQTEDTLQRIYGVAFPDKKGMVEHKKLLEEAAKRDHRKLGTDQELFFFDEISPGCVFLMPHGTIVFNALQKMLREEYLKRGYSEVQSPNMYDVSLWKTSGHWQHYKDDMFSVEVEKRMWALKPMNCPGHCFMFKHRERSYRELPLRLADFGVLHRNEASGALNGMTRVRKFQQDDAHIFARQDQITNEIEAVFEFMRKVYSLFGMTFRLKLSTRPENFLGEIEEWDAAEEQLRQALNNFKARGGGQWELNPGDGAFYGPKIDVVVTDALKREWQCATIQLDFQLPQNFNLEYQTSEQVEKSEKTEKAPKEKAPKEKAPKEKAPKERAPKEKTPKEKPSEGNTTTNGETKVDGGVKQEGAVPVRKDLGPGRARPVMIHRAIVGSFERFFAILIEHFAGKWPFWLSPRQVMVIPVMPAVNDYVEEVQSTLRANKIICDINIGPDTLQKKILRAQQAQYNFVFVVGATEKETKTVNIRNRDDQASQKKGVEVPLDVAVQKLKALRKERRMVNEM